MQNSLKWCFKLKDGLKILEPDNDLAKSYLNEAKSSLKRAERNFLENDLLWATVVLYYAEYYALYSFLQNAHIIITFFTYLGGGTQPFFFIESEIFFFGKPYNELIK